VRGLAGLLRQVQGGIVRGFIIGGVLAVLLLMCADEPFAAAVLVAVWVAVVGAIAVLDTAERRRDRDGAG
jgi:hypothetical protein